MVHTDVMIKDKKYNLQKIFKKKWNIKQANLDMHIAAVHIIYPK